MPISIQIFRGPNVGAHPVGRVAGVLAGGSVGARHWVATRYDTRELALVDAAALRGVRVALPDSGQPREVVEGPAGVVVLSDEWDGTRSTTKLTIYRVADIVPSAEAPRTPSASRPAGPRG